MSRGPGRWQREILQATEGGWRYLVDLLPDRYRREQYVALYRAMTTLHNTGRIEVVLYRYGAKKVALGPVGTERPCRCVLDGKTGGCAACRR